MNVLVELPIYGITITITGPKKGTIKSNLSLEGLYGLAKSTRFIREERIEANAMLKAIEVLVLAHALQGVDLWEPGYLHGLNIAVEGILKQYA